MNITTPFASRRSRLVSIGAAAMVVIVASSAVTQTADRSTSASPTPPAAVTEYEELRDLVNRGIVPRQALEPARMTDEEQLRDLVNRGIVPREALLD
jgi:hypothetical protein